MPAVLGGLRRERRKQKWRNFRLVFGENWGDAKRGSSLVTRDGRRSFEFLVLSFELWSLA